MKQARNLSIGIYCAALSSCFQLFNTSNNTKIKEVYNFDRTKKAILFLKNGNATESDSYQVSIKLVKDSLENNEVGNTFTTDSNHAKANLNLNSINLKWQTNSILIISYDHKLRNFIKNICVDNVAITYRAFD